MKKFLVGIVTLVAAVMLTSPAFGAWYDSFVFEDEFGNQLGLVDLSPSDNPLELSAPPPPGTSPDAFGDLINQAWGAGCQRSSGSEPFSVIKIEPHPFIL